MFGFNLALGWHDRCEEVGKFSPLNVTRISRLDLLAMKLVSAAKRLQDITDLDSMKPTGSELDFLEAHLDRLEREDLDRQTFDRQRSILAGFREPL